MQDMFAAVKEKNLQRLPTPEKPSKPVTTREESILTQLTSLPVNVDATETPEQWFNLTAAEYDNLYLQALSEREAEVLKMYDGTVAHPSARAIRIGIESIRQGKPSELFLVTLEKIIEQTDSKDLFNVFFPAEFPRRIKKVTLKAAQRDAKIVQEFTVWLREYLAKPRTVTSNGKEGIDSSWWRKSAKFSEAIAQRKLTMSSHEIKEFERALKKQGENLSDWIRYFRAPQDT